VIKSRVRWTGHVERMENVRNAYRILVRNPEGKIPLGQPKLRYEDNRMKGWEYLNWMQLAQNTDQLWVLLNTVINFRAREWWGVSCLAKNSGVS
jgi:hypothetical protein